MEAIADRFVGRSLELAQIERSYDVGHRIVTVCGAPGMGKTRLAQEFRRRLEAHRGGDAWFCPCDSLTVPEALWQRVGHVLGVGQGGATGVDTLLSRIAAWLAPRDRPVLVLDNFEQLVSEARSSVAQLAGLVPSLRILVTSRRRLDVRGEAVLLLGPLSMQPAGDGAEHAEAVELFVARTEAASGTRLGATELADARAIVASVEAVPLAIELAAARAARIGVAEVRARLAQGMTAIESTSGDERSTLTAAIEWSWTLLSEHERLALADCSVFRAGFSLEAAEAVILPGADGTRAAELLERLIDRSLVRSTQAPDGSGRRRFSLYESIREWVSRRRRDEGAEARHAAYFARVGRAWSERLSCSGDREAQAQLTLEQDNLLAVARRRSSHAAEAILALDPLWRSQGPHALHLALLDEGLALVAADDTAGASGPALLVARGEAQRRRGRVAEALADLRAGAAAARIAEQPIVEGRALAALAIIEHQGGRLEAALELATAAIALHRGAGDGRHERVSRITLGLTLVDQERLDEAQAHFEETLGLAREAGDRWAEGLVDMELGRIVAERGRFDEARSRVSRAVRVAIEVGDHRNQALALGFLAGIDHEAGALDGALANYHAALALLREAPGYRFEGLFQGRLGALCADLGQLDDAVAAMDVAASIARRVGDPALHRALRLHAGHLALKRWYAPDRGVRSPGAPGVEVEIAALLDGVRSDGSEEIRYAQRLLRTRLDAVRGAAPDREPGLTIGAGALRFRIGNGDWVSLVRRRALSRLLAALARARRSTPGQPLDLEALICVGWPGERFSGGSGVSRLRMAIATMRKLGLRDVLVTSGAGYQLDPAITVHFESEPD